MRQFMEKYDLLVTPSLPIPAFAVGRLTPDDHDGMGKWVNWTPFTYPFNLTQQPAASVPCGFTASGLPAGLHIVGRMFDESKGRPLYLVNQYMHAMFDTPSSNDPALSSSSELTRASR